MAGGVGGAGGGRGRSVPPGADEKRKRFVHLSLAALLVLNLVGIGGWPWLGPAVRGALDPLYGWLCHRVPERCYVVGGEPMPACARCVGVWLGLAVMALTAALAGVWSLRTGLLLLGAMLLSWALGGWVLPETWHVERTLTGTAGGMGAYVLAARGWRMAARLVRRTRAGLVSNEWR